MSNDETLGRHERDGSVLNWQEGVMISETYGCESRKELSQHPTERSEGLVMQIYLLW